MKNRLPVAVCVLIAAALVIFGLVYGTWTGFREDRAEADALLYMENGLMDVIGYRAADGLNLCAVAKRHLPAKDEELKRLEDLARQLMQTTDVRAAASLDHEVKAMLDAVSEKLRQTDSFHQSQRDQRYLDLLTADWNSLYASDVVTVYNQTAAGFNAQLDAPVSGWLASMLGIEKCPLYE